jgi:predicted nucleotidyltransferase
MSPIKSTKEGIAESRAAYAGLLKDSVRRLVEKLSSLDQVERVSLFGSYARGRADLFTDLDVLVVMRSKEPFVERVKRLYGLLALPVDLYLLCYTPREFANLKDQPFLKRILQEEMVLYEKTPD